jgi:hypothetical protein
MKTNKEDFYIVVIEPNKVYNLISDEWVEKYSSSVWR